jgi:hypothetical protein
MPKRRFKMKRWLIAILILGMVIGIAGSSWAVPRMINVQGRVAPRPDNGVQIKFSIFDAVGGGTLLWENKRFITDGTPAADQIQLDAEGVFSVILGPWDDDGIPMPEFLEDNFYLEIEIGGARLEPRQRLVAVPFAITSRNVRGGTVVAQSETWHGVRGESSGTGLSSGVTGANLSTEPDAGIGVSGLSSTFGMAGAGGRIGVSGFGGVESLGVPTVSGVGVYGVGVRGVVGFDRRYDLDHTGTYGVLGGTSLPIPGIGVVGIRRYGVYGQANDDNKGVLGYYAAGFGLGPAVERGVYAKSVNGYGLWAEGGSTKGGVFGRSREFTPHVNDFGVYGYGNYGVVGRGDDTTGIGVLAVGGVYGVSASSPGTGVAASSSSDTNAGVLAGNTGDGPALEIGSGWIKIPSTDLVFHGGASSIESNFLAGTITNNNLANFELTIRNDRLTEDSIVLISPMNELAVGAYAIVDAAGIGPHHIRINGLRADGGRISFFIIN